MVEDVSVFHLRDFSSIFVEVTRLATTNMMDDGVALTEGDGDVLCQNGNTDLTLDENTQTFHIHKYESCGILNCCNELALHFRVFQECICRVY